MHKIATACRFRICYVASGVLIFYSDFVHCVHRIRVDTTIPADLMAYINRDVNINQEKIYSKMCVFLYFYCNNDRYGRE